MNEMRRKRNTKIKRKMQQQIEDAKFETHNKCARKFREVEQSF